MIIVEARINLNEINNLNGHGSGDTARIKEKGDRLQKSKVILLLSI